MIKKFDKCFRHFTPRECPMYRLEIEKLAYMALLVIAVVLLLACTFGIK